MIDSSRITERVAAHHAARPKLQRMWGAPPPLHEAFGLAKKAERRITTLLGGHASAVEATRLAAAYPERTVFSLRSEPFDEAIALPTGHLITYRGNWFAALVGLKPNSDSYGPADHIVLLPEFSTHRTIAPFELLRALLANYGRLSALVPTMQEAKKLAAEFRTVFTPARNETVHIYGFQYHADDIAFPINLESNTPEIIDSMDIQEISASHFPKALPEQPSPFYWVIASRISRHP